MKSGVGLLTQTSNLISIIVAIFGLLGIYFTPQNANFIIVGVGIIILLTYLFDKVQQISKNTESIKYIYQRISISERLHRI